MIDFSEDPRVTTSMQHWRGRSVLPTNLGSAELRGMASEIHLRSITSARTTNAEYLQEVGDVVDEMLAGKINTATGRLRLMRKLRQLGYDPETGFPGETAAIPPADRGSLQDLSSEQRIDLMLKTNVALARNYGRAQAGNTSFARYAWPAWELVRIGRREIERGTPESHTAGWPRRWADAGEAVLWDGALTTQQTGGRMVALKGSPIWTALADGEGGYTDTLGHSFPPFAFNSGMDWRAVKRAEWEQLNQKATKPRRQEEAAAETTAAALAPSLAPTESQAAQIFARLSPDLREALKARWRT